MLGAPTKSPNLGAFLTGQRPSAQGVVVVVVLDLVAVSLSLLEELSDAFLANRAAAIAGQPASDTTTGTAIKQSIIFEYLFIVEISS